MKADKDDPTETQTACPECLEPDSMWVDLQRREGWCSACGHFHKYELEVPAELVECCPYCEVTEINERVGKRPRFRCQNGHKFQQLAVREEKERGSHCGFTGAYLA